jgi:hypothetical protein
MKVSWPANRTGSLDAVVGGGNRECRCAGDRYQNSRFALDCQASSHGDRRLTYLPMARSQTMICSIRL